MEREMKRDRKRGERRNEEVEIGAGWSGKAKVPSSAFTGKAQPLGIPSGIQQGREGSHHRSGKQEALWGACSAWLLGFWLLKASKARSGTLGERVSVLFGFLLCRLGRGTRFALGFCGIFCEVPHRWILRIHPEGQVLISSIWEVKADDLKGGIERKRRPKVIGILPTIPLIRVLSKLCRNSPLPIP